MDPFITPRTIRRKILDIAFQAHVGHIGSALSITEIITALYSTVLVILSPTEADRDRMILSKGHAAMALYAALNAKGWLSEKLLNGYCHDGSLLGTHPDHELPGVDFCAGSLGHGICYAAGAAIAARYQGSRRRVFAIVSDAECNEGSLWEAVMFAAHQKLDNLFVIVDNNGQQALGCSDDVLKLYPLAKKWDAFGWDVRETNGHDVDAISGALRAMDVPSGKPHVLIADTISGKGVSFMEKQIKWHYWPMSEQEYHQALAEVGE